MFTLIIYLYSIIQYINYPATTGELEVLSITKKTISLENRNQNSFVNEVFRDNILLTLHYMEGRVDDKSDIVWDDIKKPSHFKFVLKPGEGFAFHNQILPEYDIQVIKTTNANFNYQDGFKSDGYLMGDGVCHLASLIYWAAKDAGLKVYAPTNHNFANINEVPKEYGVSIYSLPGSVDKSGKQNLYITNNLDNDVSFIFNYDGNYLTLNVVESIL